MNPYYQETENYWNQVFDQAPTYDATKPLPYDALEDALAWLSEGKPSVLDFGCGHGKMALRCLAHGAGLVCGMDLSASAIDVASKVAENHGYEDRSCFLCKGVNALDATKSQSYDAAILFNIVDNLLPLDALCTLRQIARILKEDGRLLLKLNPYLDKEEITKQGIEQVGEHIYREASGLYLWNLTDEQWEAVLETHFHIQRYEVVSLSPHPVTQRLYYLTKKD